MTSTVEIETPEGSAMVWLNCLPHRVRRVAVAADGAPAGEKLRRSFVNFFMVDPAK